MSKLTLQQPQHAFETPDPGLGTHQSQPSRGLRILLIDDDSDFRYVLKQSLQSEGHTVVTAAGGSSGLTILMEEKVAFDIVLLDYFMPELNGLQTLSWLRKLECNVKVIIISAADPLHLRQIQAHHPVDGFLGKPLSIQELSHELRRVTSKTSELPA
jgi:CheY-like chemotaxis protein